MEDTDLNRIQTTESVFLPISREAFEKLYLTPKNPHVTGDLRKKVGNPTPISLLGFLIASTSNACIMMGWRGSGGQGAAIVYVFLSVVTYGDLVLGITMWLIEYSPVFIFFGGMVQIFGGVGEWIIGNTFTCALFFTYGVFCLVFTEWMMGTNEIRNLLYRPWSPSYALFRHWDSFLTDGGFSRGSGESHVPFEFR